MYRYKPLSLKQKIAIYATCIAVAIIAAIVVVCILVHICQKELPLLSSSNDSVSSTSEYYDIVDIIEPEAEEIIIETETDGDTVTITVTEIIEMVQEVQQTEENTVVVKPTTIDASGLKKRQIKLDVDYLSQYPELPTGCEITSLTTVLNYYGYDVSKTTMSDDYLEKSIDKVANFWEIFLGNPRSNGFGCYAGPIVKAANKYLEEQDNKYKAVNASGTQFEKLLKEVENGNPVIIWSTMYNEKINDLREPYTTYKWEIDGKTIQWIAPEHCMVLIGYDIDRNVAIMSDPQRGIVEYNLETVKSRYAAMHSQCVILQENDIPPVIEGVTDGKSYYTTQYVTVTDDNLKSVTVNYKHSENEFFIDGNAENTYEITATDTSGNQTSITIYTKPISSIAESITNLTEFNVTEEHREAVNDVRDTALNVSTQYSTLEESSALNQIIINCDTLLDKIESVSNEYNRITTAVGDYETEIPGEEDIEIINTLITDIDALLYSENLTEEQQLSLDKFKIKCQELLLLIPPPEQKPDESEPDINPEEEIL